MAEPAKKVSKTSDSVSARTPKDAHPAKGMAGVGKYLDERIGIAAIGKGGLRKIFPDHWSFLLGEVALYSFIVLLLTGVFLTIWFKPSMAEIEYEGTYQMMRGLPMSEAFASTMTLSFDIRGGLLVRQMHHWGAMLFIGAMFAHALRVFFTGAFRKPRELNWLIGVGLLSMGMVEGFAGYSLPDDLLSGTGLRFADGLMRSIPIVGTWVEFFVFGGEYPGDLVIPRLYMVHILLLPGLLLGLIAAHMSMLVYHKHTHFPGPGATDRNVVGYPLFPVYTAKAGGFFFIVSGMITLMGALLTINPVWIFGPYNPSQVTAGSQPDWYMGPAEGAVRIMPGWESHIAGTTWSWNIAVPGLGMLGLLFISLAVYPFIEQWITGDKSEHHVLDRPHQAPTRTALGVAAMTAYAMFWLSGGNDILATTFHLSLNAVTYFMRVAVFLAPIAAFIITKRICLGMQRKDQERLLHGSESGNMERSADGEYFEPHTPVSEDEAWKLTQHTEYVPLEAGTGTDEHGVETESVSKRRAKWSKWFYQDRVDKPTAEELEEAREHALHHDAELEAAAHPHELSDKH